VKANKSTTLTPVGTEAARMLPRIDAPFPNDHPLEVIESLIRELSFQYDTLGELIDSLRRTAGKPREEEAPPPPSQRQIEREADARAEAEPFAEKFAKMQEEAQAATYKPVGDHWQCPKHGNESLRDAASPKGRKYTACAVANCKEFQR